VRWLFGIAAVAACGRVGFDTSAQSRMPRADAPPDAVVDEGLIGWWKLGDGAGTVAADSSGHGDDGVLSAGVTWVAGRDGSGAISIAGGVDHDVDLGNVPQIEPTGSMTLAAWVNAGTLTTTFNDDVIISRDDFAGGYVGWVLKIGTLDCGTLAAAIQIASDATTSPERCSTTMPTTNTWYHVAGVYDATAATLDLYVDGVLDDGTLVNPPVPHVQYEPASQVHVQIGAADPAAGDVTGGVSLDGIVQDLRMYDRALQPAEIATLAQ
jgi:hypothetical protein